MEASPSPEEELRRAGLRVTGQRALILRLIRASKEHLDAEDIYAAARAQDSSLSLATVYRTIGALKRAGLVEQRYPGTAMITTRSLAKNTITSPALAAGGSLSSRPPSLAAWAASSGATAAGRWPEST